VVEQITLLLALTAGLLDSVPLARMPAAEDALRRAAATIPAEVVGRFATAAQLAQADRAVVLAVAGAALAVLQAEA
jgi:F-type H+-transporting ATPase subunit alpha